MTMMTEQADATPDPKTVVTKWRAELDKEERAHKDYRDLADKAQEMYEKAQSYSIMFPTVQIMSASLYSSTPNPEIMRRQKDGDKPQKDAAQILERGIDYFLDTHDFDGHIEQGLLDFLVAGLGQVRAIYTPEFGTGQDAYGQPMEVITAQNVSIKHYSWKDFQWQPGKDWESVEWVAFTHHMNKKQVMDDYDVEATEDDKDVDSGRSMVKVKEIYHKTTKTVTTICEQFDTPLEIRKDELGLSAFFPCPKPMLCNVLTDKLVPFADYKYYEEQAKDLNRNSKRISSLVKSIKAVSFYDQHFTDLAKIKNSKDGTYIPIENLLDVLDGGNVESALAEVPYAQKVAVVEILTVEQERLKAEVYEILGIADIMRGETNSQEGVETQKLKSEFGAVRIRGKQITIDTFCRGVFRIMAEIIAEHFEPDILQKMTGVQVSEEVMYILRNDMMRNMSIDVETDSTNAADKIRNQQARTEALAGITEYLTGILPAMENGMMSREMGQELMLLAIRGFDVGSSGNLEDIITQMGEEGSPEQVIEQLQQQLGEAQQQLEEMNAQMQQMGQALQKADEASTAKDFTAAKLNDAKAQKTLAEIPGEAADVALTQAEIQGKTVEQAGNILAGAGREPFIRGVE